MSISINLKKTILFLQNQKLLIILSMLITSSVHANEEIALKLYSAKMDYRQSETIKIFVGIENSSNEAIGMMKVLSPEGWLVRIKIKDAKGISHYESPFAKVEMTDAQLQSFPLPSGYIYGKEFKISKTSGTFSSGESFQEGIYYIEASFSTLLLKNRKLNVPIGEWASLPVKIEVSKDK